MVQNNLESISRRIHELVSELFPTDDTEMEIIHSISFELFETLEDEENIKKALVNMFLAGQIFTNK